MLGTILFPFVLSFDKKVHFYKRWKYLLPSIAIPAFIFLLWDVIFTYYKIWEFSPEYTIGVNILLLPIEEWMFFLFVPYACVFVYDVIKYYWPNFNYPIIAKRALIIMLGISIMLIFFNTNRVYTFTVSIILALTIIYLYFVAITPSYLFRFFIAYLICLVPFMLVNGILTFLPVVIYNNTENLGIRIFSIPVEDALYFMTLFLMNIGLYEYFQNRQKNRVIESIAMN